MMKKVMYGTGLVVVGVLVLVSLGCSKSGPNGKSSETVVRIEGSDTMVNLAQAWAERYHEQHPEISVQVSGGGSGVGIASLIEGVTDLANASRKMKDKEFELAKRNSGKEPKEFIVGFDALAVFVHKDNPIESVSLEELAEIYGDGGDIVSWKQLGADFAGCASGKITRVSRQNSSGTFHYFREAVLGKKRDYKQGAVSQSGSKDVVALISSTPCAIGYSGMGYRTDEVKVVKVSKIKGESGVEPSVENAKNNSYPITRPLHIYTLGEPTGAAKDFLDWIMSPEGQKLVLEIGYVPVGETAE